MEMRATTWAPAELAAGTGLIAGALFVSADVTRWGTWQIPVLPRVVIESVAVPGLPLVAAALAFAGAAVSVTRKRPRLVLALFGLSLAAIAVASVRTVKRLLDLFQGQDSTDWARYSPLGAAPASHSYSWGLLASVLGVLLLLVAAASAARPLLTSSFRRRCQGPSRLGAG